MTKSMSEFIKRLLTSAALLFIFGGAYLHSALLFFFTLLVVMIFALVLEWRYLIPDAYSIKKSFFVSLFYPLSAFLSIMLLPLAFYEYDFYLPLLPFFIAWSSDTGGYVVGKLCGKHKICPTISPGKTWEGLFGSFIGVSIACSWILPRIVTHPFLVIIQHYSIFFFFTFIFTILSFLGGMIISFLKRKKGVKDSGSILPGHGGLLDRFDSVLLVAPALWIILILDYNLSLTEIVQSKAKKINTKSQITLSVDGKIKQ